MKFSVFIATSVDGMIARKDGSIDWLDPTEKSPDPNEDHGYAQFISNQDCVVMGSKSFEKVATFDPWPYHLPVYVLSERSREELKLDELKDRYPESNVTLFSGSVPELVNHLADKLFFDIYVDGGKVISSFIQAGFMNEITITTIPVLIGDGCRLFDFKNDDIRLKVIKTIVYPNGYIQTKYLVSGKEVDSVSRKRPRPAEPLDVVKAE